MRDAKASRALKRALVGIVGSITLVLFAGMIVVLTPQPTMAKPEFATQTKKPCAFCHQNPSGGLPLNSRGEKFKANGNKL